MAGSAPTPRDVGEGFFFKQARKLQIEDYYKYSDSNKSCIVSSSRYGLIFASCNTGVKVLYLKDLLSLDNSVHAQRTNAALSEVTHQEILLPTFPLHLALSCDDLSLAVCYAANDGCPCADVYDVRSFANQNNQPRPFCNVRLSNDPKAQLLDLLWNPSQCEMFATCMSNGATTIYQAKESSLDICSSSNNAEASSICWSPKGKQLVVGKFDGCLVQYKLNMQPAKTIPAPTCFSKAHSVTNICWLSSFLFAAVYKSVNDNATSFVIVSTPKGGAISYVNYGDLLMCSGQSSNPAFHMKHLAEWNMLIMASNTALETGVLVASSSDKTIWEQWILEDSGRAELPLTKHDESYAAGMSISFCAQDEVTINEQLIFPPMPVLLLLSTSGVLCPFHAVNTNQAFPRLTTMVETLKLDGLRKGRIAAVAPSRASTLPQQVKLSTENVMASTPKISAGFAKKNLMSCFNQVDEQSSKPPETPVVAESPASIQVISAEPAKSFPLSEIASPTIASVSKPEMTNVPGMLSKGLVHIPKDSPSIPAAQSTSTVKESIKEESKSTRDGVLAAALQEEINGFQKELDSLKSRCSTLKIELGDVAEKTELKERSAEATESMTDSQKVMKDFGNDVYNLKNMVLDSFCIAEEARSIQFRNKDRKYIHLLRSRGLDPISKRNMSRIMKLYQYVDHQLHEVQKMLDYQWSEHLEKKKQSYKKFNIPSTETIYQTLKTISEVNRRKKLELVKMHQQLKAMHTDIDQTRDGELSKMADSLLNIQNHEETKASPKKKSMTPEKQNQLRDLLSRRKVTPVKCTKPENLSESRFLATLILEAEEKEIEEQTEAVTPPQSSLKLANSESKISSNSVATKKHVTHNIGGLVNPKSTVAKKIDKTDITEGEFDFLNLFLLLPSFGEKVYKFDMFLFAFAVASILLLAHEEDALESFGEKVYKFDMFLFAFAVASILLLAHEEDALESLLPIGIAPLSSTSTPFTFKSKPEISKPQFNEIKPLAPASILPVYEDITPPGTPASTTPVSGSQPQSIVRNLFTGGSTSSAFSAPSKSIEEYYELHFRTTTLSKVAPVVTCNQSDSSTNVSNTTSATMAVSTSNAFATLGSSFFPSVTTGVSVMTTPKPASTSIFQVTPQTMISSNMKTTVSDEVSVAATGSSNTKPFNFNVTSGLAGSTSTTLATTTTTATKSIFNLPSTSVNSTSATKPFNFSLMTTPAESSSTVTSATTKPFGFSFPANKSTISAAPVSTSKSVDSGVAPAAAESTPNTIPVTTSKPFSFSLGSNTTVTPSKALDSATPTPFSFAPPKTTDLTSSETVTSTTSVSFTPSSNSGVQSSKISTSDTETPGAKMSKAKDSSEFTETVTSTTPFSFASSQPFSSSQPATTTDSSAKTFQTEVPKESSNSFGVSVTPVTSTSSDSNKTVASSAPISGFSFKLPEGLEVKPVSSATTAQSATSSSFSFNLADKDNEKSEQKSMPESSVIEVSVFQGKVSSPNSSELKHSVASMVSSADTKSMETASFGTPASSFTFSLNQASTAGATVASTPTAAASGSLTTSNATNPVFGSTTNFGMAAQSGNSGTPSVFGNSNAMGFGSPQTQSSSIFGNTPVSSAPSQSVFGAPAQGTSVFGNTMPGFGQASGFGSPTTASGSETFGFGNTTPIKTGNVFGNTENSGGFFSGLGGKPSAENANKNVFSSSSFGSGNSGNIPTSNLFGNTQNTGFGFTGSQTPGAFSSDKGSVSQTGFGGFNANTTPQNQAFGGAATFGLSPGMTSSFGGGALFGSKAVFSESANVFSNQSQTAFTDNVNSAVSFGALAAQGSNTVGFGALPQSSSPSLGPFAQQDPGFGSPPAFGSSPAFGSMPTSPTSPAFGSAPSSNNSSFSQWRS
ncbi:Nuclear pore complex protein Nup214 [Nymphon striatum]|nr:Nuclear pore complex protein Nup214 [Nymphon striatum]